MHLNHYMAVSFAGRSLEDALSPTASSAFRALVEREPPAGRLVCAGSMAFVWAFERPVDALSWASRHGDWFDELVVVMHAREADAAPGGVVDGVLELVGALRTRGVWYTPTAVAHAPSRALGHALLGVRFAGRDVELVQGARGAPEALVGWHPDALEYIERVERAVEGLVGRPDAEALRWLGRQKSAIDALLRRALGVDDGACARLLVAIGRWRRPLWSSRGAHDAAVALSESRARAGERWERVCMVRLLQLVHRGQSDETAAFAEELLRVEGVGDELLASALYEAMRAQHLGSWMATDGPSWRRLDACMEVTGDEARAPRARALVWSIRMVDASDGLAPMEVHEEKLARAERALEWAECARDAQATLDVLLVKAEVLGEVEPREARVLLDRAIEGASVLGLEDRLERAWALMARVAARTNSLPLARRVLDALVSHPWSERTTSLTCWTAYLRVWTALVEGRIADTSKPLEALRESSGDSAGLLNSEEVTFLGGIADVLSEHRDARGTYSWYHWNPGLGRLSGSGHAVRDEIDSGGWPGIKCDELVESLSERASSKPACEFTDLAWRAVLTLRPKFANRWSRPSMVVDGAWAWFVSSDGAYHDLSDEPVLRGILAALVEAQHESATTPLELHERVWPGESFGREGARRVERALDALRAMGLMGFVERRGFGWSLSPDVMVVRALF